MHTADHTSTSKGSRAALVTRMPVRDRSAIASYCDQWNMAGFDVYSVNSEQERLALSAYDIQNLRTLSAKEDASDLYGRPLIFIDEAVALAQELGTKYPLVGLVNADVLPSFMFGWNDLLGTIDEGTLHCFKRLDLERFPGGTCTAMPAAYPFGYDLVLCRSATPCRLSRDPGQFAFGIPW